MSLFVEACAAIQLQIGGAVIGVHHAGKDSARGMRGSTVLLGACDASLKVSKDEAQRATIDIEKQKDAEEAKPIHMEMKKVEWAEGFGKEESTLVPVRSEQPSIERRELSKQQALQIFEQIKQAWMDENPWSTFPQAKRRGRYLPDWMAEEYQITAKAAVGYLVGWQQRQYLETATTEGRNPISGLRVVKLLEADR